MNVLALYHDMEKRGVHLEANGENLMVDAPAGVLSEEDRAALVEAKPLLLKMLTPRAAEAHKDHRRRFDAKPSRYLGYTSLYDPVEGEWHDFSTRDCYPSIVEGAKAKRRKGGVA